MYFYVDESGHTGVNLFDEAQPMLYYGVLSSRLNVDVLAEDALAKLRKDLGVNRLHANELGNGSLVTITKDLCRIQKQLDFRFDIYRVAKPDHAIICFFDQVFDSGINPAMTWTGYWTPLRYVLLVKLASLFDEELAKIAWNARISVDNTTAHAGLIRVCEALIKRSSRLPDLRSRQLIGDCLTWAIRNPDKLSYNVSDKQSILQVSPNIIGFQSVMLGIANRIKSTQLKASKIIVDQQSQFNKAQRTLAEFYAAAKGVEVQTGPGMPIMDLQNIPVVPIEFSSSNNSAGLELVDINLWIFKRFMEKRDLAPQLFSLIRPHLHRGRTDEVSINGIIKRWTQYFKQIPELDEMTEEQIKKGKEILKIDEERRVKNLISL